MGVDKEKLEAALHMLPIHHVRDLIHERNLNIKSRRKDELVDALVEQDWTDEEFDDLITWIEELQIESEPLGHYIAEIESVETIYSDDQVEQIAKTLENTPAEFDEDGNLLEEGYELDNIKDNFISGTHWSETLNYFIDPLGNLKPRSKLYGTGFEIDFELSRIYVYAEMYGKAQGLLSNLDELGLKTEPVGLQDLNNDRANDKMQEFVNEFKTEVEKVAEKEDDDQSTINDYN